MSADPRLAEAAQARLADDFEAARQLCQAVLAERPDDAEALSLLGVCAIESGDMAAGRAWLDKAEAVAPDHASLHLYRSIQHEAGGDAEQALAAARRASEAGPHRFDTWGRYGDLAGRADDFATSAAAFAEALKAEPEHPARAGVALRLAAARVETGDLAGAAEALGLAEAAGLAGHIDVLRLRAGLDRQAGDWEALRRHAEAWLKRAPNDMEARSAVALALSQTGYYRPAADVFRPVLEADSGNAEHWAAYGRLMLGARDLGAAEAAFSKAMGLDVNCAEASFGLARIHTFMGRIEDAAAACRRTLEIDPGHFEAYGQLCEVSGGQLSDAELARLAQETEKPGQAVDRLAIGLFALGDAHHGRKQRAEAFEAWSRANRTKMLQHTGQPVSAYDRARQEGRTDWLMEVFDGPGPERAAPRPGQPVPVFIVGMPRSGTTLLEAAMAAHEEAVAGGELSAMIVIFEDFMRWAEQTGWQGGEIPEAKLDAWRQRYRQQYRDTPMAGARYVTDKQPSNFLAVGLIRRLFPEAPIIHIRRKPLETGFSIFRRNFSRMWPFAHDLEDIAHYYAQQARLGDHWARVMPDTVTPLQYEELVQDFEGRLRYVMARARMSWSRRCLEFYKPETDRAVMTFSAVQVRKPPSPKHLDSTSAYADQLAPLAEAIRRYPVDPETGAWLGNASSEQDTEEAGGFWSRLGRRLTGRTGDAVS
ncbi:tetratricopeptide repeat-containing sulfotransferase family protein [Maricaulis sp. CAU 1757]